MRLPRAHHGYVFLLSVLVVGTMAVATLGSLLFIGLGLLRTSATVEQSEQAFALAHTCAERALRALWEDAGYRGNEQLTFPQGTCNILHVGGSGNENRSLCVEGRAGETRRRFEIILGRLLPSIQVYSWQEVENFSSCS